MAKTNGHFSKRFLFAFREMNNFDLLKLKIVFLPFVFLVLFIGFSFVHFGGRHAMTHATLIVMYSHLQVLIKPFANAIFTSHPQIRFSYFILCFVDGYFDVDLCVRCTGTNDERLSGLNDWWNGKNLYSRTKCTLKWTVARRDWFFNYIFSQRDVHAGTWSKLPSIEMQIRLK